MTQRLRDRLNELHKLTAQTPLFNPVFQLGLDLSREIESGALPLDEVAALVEELGCEALQSRAYRHGADTELGCDVPNFQAFTGQKLTDRDPLAQHSVGVVLLRCGRLGGCGGRCAKCGHAGGVVTSGLGDQ